jgi:tetratricopeptide (TPR) repeat protein
MSDDARRTIRNLIAQQDAEALYQLGVAHLQSGEWAIAEDAFRGARAVGHKYALHQLGWVLDNTGRLDEAEEAYRTAIDEGDEAAILSLADMILVRPERQGEAEELINRAVAAEVPSAYYVLGKLLARQPGREREAEAALAAETHPSLKSLALFELAHLLEGIPGREDDVEEALRSSGSPAASMELAAILLREPGRHDEAIALLRRAAEVGYHGAWNNLTVVLKEFGRYADAAAAYEDGISSGESDLIVHYGNFLFERGQVDQAEAVLRQGVASDARCAYLLGVILSGQPERSSEGRQLLVSAAASGVIAAALQLGR